MVMVRVPETKVTAAEMAPAGVKVYVSDVHVAGSMLLSVRVTVAAENTTFTAAL